MSYLWLAGDEGIDPISGFPKPVPFSFFHSLLASGKLLSLRSERETSRRGDLKMKRGHHNC